MLFSTAMIGEAASRENGALSHVEAVLRRLPVGAKVRSSLGRLHWRSFAEKLCQGGFGFGQFGFDEGRAIQYGFFNDKLQRVVARLRS